MGFYLKKSASYLLNPLSFVLLLLFVSLWFLYRKRHKRAIALLTTATVLLVLFAYRPFSYMLMHPLESRYARLTEAPENITHILLLGGDLERRGWEVLRLHQMLPKARIITTGYAGDYFESAAMRTKRFLTDAGIDPKQIIPMADPKDTIEEAGTIKRILGNRPFILVTSAYHMPRAMMIFEHTGVHPIPAPTDFVRKTRRFWSLPPKVKYLYHTQKALHEYLGILWLKLKWR